MSTQRQFLLGIFFLSALSILGFYTLFLTDFTLFKDPIRMEVYFPDAHDLREGDPVMISGLRIGRVKGLGFDADAPVERRIRATLNLSERIELLEGTRITIQESTLLGGRKVDIYPGNPGGPPLPALEDGAYFGHVEPNPIAALGSFGDLLNENREAINGFLRNLDAVTENLREGRGSFGRMLTDETMADDLAASVASFRAFGENASSITDDVRAGRGVLGSLVGDEALAQEVRDTLENLRQITTDLQAGQGLLGRLVYDDALAEDATAAFRSFRNVGERMDTGESALGLLLADAQAAEDLREILTNLRAGSSDFQEVLARVNRGEGSLGKILVEEDLYEEAMRGLALLTRTLEDYREAAPITAFTGVLFSAF